MDRAVFLVLLWFLLWIVVLITGSFLESKELLLTSMAIFLVTSLGVSARYLWKVVKELVDG